MKLSAWLEKNAKTQAWFAKRLKCDQGRVSKLASGEVMPTMNTIRKIELITKNEVSFRDWVVATKKPKCVGPTCSVPQRGK